LRKNHQLFQFKQFKLLDIVNIKKARKIEKKAARIAAIAATIPDSKVSLLGRRGLSSRLVNRYKRRLLGNLVSRDKWVVRPDYFLLEIYNPNENQVDITFSIRAVEGEKNVTPYQKLLKLGHGLHKVKIDYTDIHDFMDPGKKHLTSLTPNFDDSSPSVVTVYFGFLGFVKENEYVSTAMQAPGKQSKIAKVVAWDLDNTVWKGILVEDGSKNLKLMPDIKHIMETLDSRGIVNSVISKNNFPDAIEQLKLFELEELVVFPQISWLPKSQTIKTMINEFNIAADTVVFVDDSAFEREEVKSSNPTVRVFDACDYRDILDRPEFNPEQSPESSKRRMFYKNQNARKQVQEQFSGDYLDFVRSCNIKLAIAKARPDNVDRIQELVQRTNQMNFSGSFYQREEIVELIDNPDFDNFYIKCSDKFGDYGAVGFCIVSNKIPQVIDLMFSCRIQSKRIEHACLSWLLYNYWDSGFDKLLASYNRTTKNAATAKVFDDLGFVEKQNTDNALLYEFELSKEIPWDGLAAIEYEGDQWDI